MSFAPTLRLTPSHSPFTPRSPTKSTTKQQQPSEEPGLHLRKVIGTTAASSHGFDCLPAAGKFAFTAGAAAVVAAIDEDLRVTQHFFRANPSAVAGAKEPSSPWPVSPTPNDPRYKALGNVKEHGGGGGGSPLNTSGRDWLDSPGSRTLTAKDRVKAATSVALSPNGRWLAVGETGYRPRILIFSTKEGSSETPVFTAAEHTFGITALRFSPDSRFLASLGTVNDGFLHVWSMDSAGCATLSASNKCTTPIHAMAWMGRSIVTVGLRFVKVWRPEEDPLSDFKGTESLRSGTLTTPRPKNESRLSDFGNSVFTPKHRALAGKNSLLGELLEATFTAVVAISAFKSIVCAETGEICLLDDSEKAQVLSFAVNAGMRTTAARLDENDVLHVVGVNGQATRFLIPDLEKRAGGASGRSRRQSTSPTKFAPGTTIVASANCGNAILEINSNRVIKLSRGGIDTAGDDAAYSKQLIAHEDAVLGVQPFRSSAYPDAAFLTFSGSGTVHFWNHEGISVTEGLSIPMIDSPEMYGLTNDLKAIAPLFDGKVVSSGDRYGTVALVEVGTRKVLHQVRAHSAEVLDLIAFQRNGVQYLASASRDRTVQLFACLDERLQLLQTMDEHAGAVTGLLLSHNGDQLLSCSADRTVVVRQRMSRDSDDHSTLAFSMLRAITLKSSPTSMCLTTQDDSILISTVDRCIGRYSTKTGQPGFSFKCSDNEGGEGAVMSKILYTPSLNGNPTIAGVSSSDKSVRLYSEYGTLIARDWGHTEGITDMAVIPARHNKGSLASQLPQIVTVAADSTIFMWDSLISNIRPVEKCGSVDETEMPTSKTPPPLGPPLRKVLSQSEMSRYRKDRSTECRDPPSPVDNGTTALFNSPQKLRKRTSKISLAPAPRLEPTSRPNFDPSRRRSLRQRSPSPPSPRHSSKRDLTRKPSLGMSLRSKSSENMLNATTSNTANTTAFGSVTYSTESVCRTLRAYRKKLSSSSANEKITPDAYRELEKELKLTARVVGEKSQGKGLDEAVMAKLLEQASDKIVGLLDQKIKERVEDEVRKSGDGSPSSTMTLDPLSEIEEHGSAERHFARSDTAPGALQTLKGMS